jgi:hypothetical protein
MVNNYSVRCRGYAIAKMRGSVSLILYIELLLYSMSLWIYESLAVYCILISKLMWKNHKSSLLELPVSVGRPRDRNKSFDLCVLRARTWRVCDQFPLDGYFVPVWVEGLDFPDRSFLRCQQTHQCRFASWTLGTKWNELLEMWRGWSGNVPLWSLVPDSQTTLEPTLG